MQNFSALVGSAPWKWSANQTVHDGKDDNDAQSLDDIIEFYKHHGFYGAQYGLAAVFLIQARLFAFSGDDVKDDFLADWSEVGVSSSDSEDDDIQAPHLLEVAWLITCVVRLRAVLESHRQMNNIAIKAYVCSRCMHNSLQTPSQPSYRMVLGKSLLKSRGRAQTCRGGRKRREEKW